MEEVVKIKVEDGTAYVKNLLYVDKKVENKSLSISQIII